MLAARKIYLVIFKTRVSLRRARFILRVHMYVRLITLARKGPSWHCSTVVMLGCGRDSWVQTHATIEVASSFCLKRFLIDGAP